MDLLGSATRPTFLARMADLAREKRMKVMGIGPLEKQSSAQFTKTWHTIQVQAPYREIRELASRVERDKGIIEDVHLEEAPPAPGQSASKSSPTAQDEVQARFKMTALELSPQAKVIIDRALTATGGAAQVPPGSPLALSVPSGAGARLDRPRPLHVPDGPGRAAARDATRDIDHDGGSAAGARPRCRWT